MAQPLALALDVAETTGDRDSLEPSPYEESEVHDSFHQLIQEQSLRVAEEGLELLSLVPGRGDHTLPGPEGAPAHSSATLRILASMPSRTIGRSRGAIISQYYNRTVRLRRRSSRPLLGNVVRSARPSLRLYDLELDPTILEEDGDLSVKLELQNSLHGVDIKMRAASPHVVGPEVCKRSLLVKELQGLSGAQRDHMVRNMPLSLGEKRWLRKVGAQRESGGGGTMGAAVGPSPAVAGSDIAACCALHSLGLALLSGLYAARPWRYALKQIGGQFGSSVLSYFLFLKTLLAFNALMLLPLLAFLVGVQAAFPPDPAGPVPSFSGLELLTGGGRFTHTVMYYGYYSNTTLSQSCASRQEGGQCGPRLTYSMPLAYLFTMGATFFITCIVLVYSMSHSFGESYRVGSTKGIHALTVFCSWDYKVTQKRASRVQQDSICTQLKELLAEWQLRKRPRSACGRLRQVVVLGLGWLLCLGSTMGCTVAVLTFSEVMIQSSASGSQGVEALALPLVVSVLNLVASYLFRGLATLERHDSPVLDVQNLHLYRNLILKMAVLGVLCYHWLGRRVAALQGRCWEDFVGRELYRFMVVDFIFTLLDSLFGELVWRIISEKKLKRGQKPEFDIARNVLDLIYGQTLTCADSQAAPPFPHQEVKEPSWWEASLMANCQAPRRPWLASHMSTVFLTLLCFPSFLGAAVFLCYAVWQVRPSSTCGPFRTLDTMYEAGTVWVRRLERAGSGASWLPWLHHLLVENTFFLFLASALLLAVIYLNIQVVKGQRKVICLLKEQIRNRRRGQDLPDQQAALCLRGGKEQVMGLAEPRKLPNLLAGLRMEGTEGTLHPQSL
ncbi:Transmembrane channel-like protein [Apodemus speciosus]|uniref:Transmembrane channel-like protein n=1 Tax=Apodemus speciosus TaxID=105296 RepID=A0ABQ0FCY0_APOSI